MKTWVPTPWEFVAIIAASLCACSSNSARFTAAAASPAPAVLLPSDSAAVHAQIFWLESRIQKDPEDFIALNKLASQYLQIMRETGDATYLQRASQAARASLASLPAERNLAGLNVLAQSEYSSHEFAAARDHALLLTRLEPNKAYGYQILGDALLELGAYHEAETAFRKMEQLGTVGDLARIASNQRVARLAMLHGDVNAAQSQLLAALKLALAQPLPPRETVAWCRWQLGEVAFSRGDYIAAEQFDRDALTTFPGYYRALSSLGRVRAAGGNFADAIAQYEAAVRILPEPLLLSDLGDLYRLVGREQDAAREYALVEAIGRLNAAGGSLYNRQLALFYADHDLKAADAYAMAAREYAVRRDIYGADALAWTALKAGKLPEARSAMHLALRLNTHDSKLLYHAGMIELATADKSKARAYLDRAVALNPQFDPLQAALLKKLAL